MQMDETYQQAQEEIAENENSEEFIVDTEATIEDAEPQAAEQPF